MLGERLVCGAGRARHGVRCGADVLDLGLRPVVIIRVRSFALIRGRAGHDSPGYSIRETQIETHLLRIAQELQAAGLTPGIERLPALAEAATR